MRILKYLFAVSLGLAVPISAFALYNDVTLTTSANLKVGGYTLNISGSSAAIQSITVYPTNFTVTLASGSSITITSPTRNQLSSDISTDVTTNTCSGSVSSLALSYSGAGTVTNTITPSSTLCADTASGSTNSGGGGGGGGGGGYIAPTVTYPVVTPSPSPTLSPNVSQTPIPNASQTPVPGCPAGMTCTPSPQVAPNQSVFVRDLTLGSNGDDVKSLQLFLNTHGFTIADSGAGSPGQETGQFGQLTKRALVKYQKSVGISPASGVFGPKTRAYMSNLTNANANIPVSCPAGLVCTKVAAPAQANQANVPSVNGLRANAPLAQLVSVMRQNLSVGSNGPDVQALQNYLIAVNAGPSAQTLAQNGASGYFGQLTKKALSEYQTSVGISPASGTFGPKTQSYINSLTR